LASKQRPKTLTLLSLADPDGFERHGQARIEPIADNPDDRPLRQRFGLDRLVRAARGKRRGPVV
jgi:hypothetical protein